jgi:hypothetical protein
MTYTDEIQADCIRGKMQALIAAIGESMRDNDEALEERAPESLEYQDGFTLVMPAALSFYQSTGTGTPMLDSLAERHLDAQAAEWARQYPQRAPLPDCASDEGEHSDEAQEWETAALEGETVWMRVEIVRKVGDVQFMACFTDEVNAPHGPEYRETMDESAFLALDGPELESLAARIAESPYLSIIAKRNSGGLWHSWFGTDNGKTAYFATGGHASESDARQAVERAMR